MIVSKIKSLIYHNSKLLSLNKSVPLISFGAKGKPQTDAKPQTRPITLNPRVNP